MEIYNCNKWNKVKDVVQDGGQETTGFCPLAPYCKKVVCSLGQVARLDALKQELNELKEVKLK
jgi:hypothetical protein